MLKKNAFPLSLEVRQPRLDGVDRMGKTVNHAFESVLQRWQNYPNIAPFVERR